MTCELDDSYVQTLYKLGIIDELTMLCITCHIHYPNLDTSELSIQQLRIIITLHRMTETLERVTSYETDRETDDK